MTNNIARKQGLINISGLTTVNNSQKKPINLGNNLKDVTLQVK